MYQLWADVTWGAPFFQTFGAQHCLGRSRRADKLLQGNSLPLHFASSHFSFDLRMLQ